MLKKPAEHAHSVNVSPSRDKLDSCAEPGADLVREIASAAAKGQHPQVVILERPVLDQRQEPVLGAPLIESVHHVENAHTVCLTSMVRRNATTAAGHARVS